MKVTVRDAEGAILWERDTTGATPSGIACRGYLVDGTQAKIIEALSNASAQAVFEASAFDVADIVANAGTAAEG